MAWKDFIASRRAEATRRSYRGIGVLLVKDPDALLGRARKDRKGAEDELMGAIIARREGLAPSSIVVSVAALKSFFDYEEAQLNWKRVKAVAPVARFVADDRAPTVEEIRKLMEVAPPRERAAVLIMLSGLRIGALPGLRVQDLEVIEGGVGRLRVYRGEPEAYWGFVTPEASAAVEGYLESRRRAGEKVGPESPLFRDNWDYEFDGKKAERLRPEVAHPLAQATLQRSIGRLWKVCGVRVKGDGRPFKVCHGFRKWFKTNFPASACPLHGELDVEVLMGHMLSYHKPSPEHLLEVYRKAVPALTVGEAERLRGEMEKQEKEHAATWQEARLQLLEEKERVRALEAKMNQMWPYIEELRKRAGPA